jgi:hypothetical protein
MAKGMAMSQAMSQAMRNWIRGLAILSWVLAVSGAAHAGFPGTRAPNPSERKELMLALSTIRNLGYTETANALSAMMARGGLEIDDAMESGFYAETSFPIVGDQTIRFNARLFPDLGAPAYRVPNWGKINLVEDRVWLASILAHEWYHTTQPAWWVRTVGRFYSAREKPAWILQWNFLQRAVVPMSEADARLKSRLEALVDRAQSEVDSL